MPFIALCLECNHLTWASDYQTLQVFQLAHDEKSHHRSTISRTHWREIRLTKGEFKALRKAVKTPLFWEIFNRKTHKFIRSIPLKS